MKKDFYKILGVPKTASPKEIKSAYMKLTFKYHPDRHNNKPEDERKKYSDMYIEVKEAYEALSDPKKREIYDKYGTTEMPQQFGEDFNFGDVFGNSKFNFGSAFGESFFDPFMGFKRGRGRASREPAEFTIRCTLDELFEGCTKKLKIKRKLLGGREEEMLIELSIKPGYKKGTKFTFQEKGDQLEDGSFQDIRIVLDEKMDPVFTRNGNDLEMKINISFKELVGGFSKTINLPGRRTYTLTENDINKIGEYSVIPWRGMPYSKDPERRGDLKVMAVMSIPKFSNMQRDAMLGVLK